MAAEVDLELVRALYRRGLVYFDVPVYSDDRFSSTSPPCGAYLSSVLGSVQLMAAYQSM